MTDYLNQFEKTRLEELQRTQAFVREALHQLERILDSSCFTRVQTKTRDFLAFVVSKTLIGQAEQIKEMIVAIRVFRESTDFEPLENSKVRVAALALRRRLAEYYADEGAGDPIEIVIPIGAYVPRIRCRTPSVNANWIAKHSHGKS